MSNQTMRWEPETLGLSALVKTSRTTRRSSLQGLHLPLQALMSNQAMHSELEALALSGLVKQQATTAMLEVKPLDF